MFTFANLRPNSMKGYKYRFFFLIKDKSNITDYLEENQNFVEYFKTKHDLFLIFSVLPWLVLGHFT